MGHLVFMRNLAKEISMLFYYKRNNSKMRDNSDKKSKYGSPSFHEESIYEISTH